jgi:hypothetical protein
VSNVPSFPLRSLAARSAQTVGNGITGAARTGKSASTPSRHGARLDRMLEALAPIDSGCSYVSWASAGAGLE